MAGIILQRVHGTARQFAKGKFDGDARFVLA